MPNEPERQRDAVVIVATADSRWAAPAEQALRAAGHAVVRFGDLGYAGLLVVSRDVRILLIDSGLIGPSDAAQIARWRAADPELNVVIIGESTSGTEVRRALESGGSTYLPWPFEESQLLRVARRAP